MLAERKAVFPSDHALIDAYRARFLEPIPGPVPGTAELIDRLAERVAPLYCITNSSAEFWRAFRPTVPVLNRFRDIIVSGDEILAKPDPAIFHLAQRRFGHPFARMLFIDDNQANIASAAALGWQTHLFIDTARLEADLRARGLL